MDGKYTLTRDSWNRVQADISPDVSVAIKVLAETDARRIEKQTHAYAVLDIRTDFGPIRIRDVRIQWSVQNERFFIRWRQWSTGRMRDGRKEYLDVAGPLDPDTRSKFADAIARRTSRAMPRYEPMRGMPTIFPRGGVTLIAGKSDILRASIVCRARQSCPASNW